MKVQTLFEHEWHSVGDDFKPHHFQMLVKFNEENGNKFFQIGLNKFKTSQFVGVLTLGDITFQILPKIASGDDNTLPWNELLQEMLLEAQELTVYRMPHTKLSKNENSILDIYLRVFNEETSQILRKGLIKKYEKFEENIMAIKGSINFPKNLTKNLIHKERHVCNYTKYVQDNIYNRTLVTVLEKIPSLTNSFEIISQAKRLRFEMDGIKCLSAQELSALPKLKTDRKSDHYYHALTLARLFLINNSPSISAGRNNIISLLFDMNDLFETYVSSKLRKYVNSLSEVDVKLQNRKKFWEDKVIKPDILVNFVSEETIVIDTKWKKPKLNDPNDADLKQVYIYNNFYKSKSGFLLYPFHTDQSSQPCFGEYRDNHSSCSMAYVKLFNNRQINKAIGEEVYKLITSPLSRAE